MNILIVHRIAYEKIQYHLGIDHDKHDVVYVGTVEKLATVPAGLRCTRLVRDDLGDAICESVLAALEGRPVVFDRIISLSEYELLETARLRECLNVPGPSYADTCLVRDKVMMKRAVTAVGIDAPRFIGLRDGRLAGTAALPWTGRTVVKPTDGAASEDVVVLQSAADCIEALHRRTTGIVKLDQRADDNVNFEVEEFVDGPIIHIDGLVGQGDVLAAIGSRYIGNCQRFAANQPLGSAQFELDSEMLDWVRRVVRAVCIANGAFHLEAIEAARGVVFLEIANRTGGAGVQQATSLTWGANLQQMELQLLIDGRLANAAPLTRRGNYHGWYVFPGHAYAKGRWVPSVEIDIDDFRRDSRVESWFEREPGATFEPKPDYTLNAAPFAGLVTAPTPERVRDFMVDLFNGVDWQDRPVALPASGTATD